MTHHKNMTAVQTAATENANIDTMQLKKYASAGFHFVRIPKRNGKPTKGPTAQGWNLPRSEDNPAGYIAYAAEAEAWLCSGDNIGLALVPSGVVSFDIDDVDETRRVLAGLGLNLDTWLTDPGRVEIQSGKPGKAKLLFRVGTDQDPPPSKKLTFGKGRNARSIFELRHGSADGRTLQDVLPPSIHPDTKQPYELIGDVENIPPIPDNLAALWRSWPETLKTFDPAHEPPKEAPRKAPETIKGSRDPIAEFNAAHDLETLLERHGYRRKGRRYIRPGSESGIPGLTIFDRDGRKLCYSHGGDELNDGRAHDAFDVFRVLDHGGDLNKALAWNPEITKHNQAVWAKSRKSEARPQIQLYLNSLYMIDGGRICKDAGDIPSPLCNFTARIVEEIIMDDGEEQHMSFAIEGRLWNKKPLPRIEVAAGNFAGMSWVTGQWGISAAITAGQSSKDHLRAALQELSGDVPRRTIYGHTGWRRIGDAWRYLHAGGALGADGNKADIEVNPGAGHMANYRLPDPPEAATLAAAVRASLNLLAISPSKPEIGALLLACIYRAPLAEAVPIDHAAWLVGYTGARKSEVAALMLAHFGQGFTSRSFPANWTDTHSALEVKAHAAKDAVFIVDDFKPHGGKGEIDAFHSKADKLIRGVGNQAGRGRLHSDLKQRAAYYARGFVLATGEDIPRGQSLRARMTIAQISRDVSNPRNGDVDIDHLTTMQGHARAGTLVLAMAGFIRWLAPQIDDLKKTLPEAMRTRRDKAANKGLNGHSRAPSDYASLTAGISLAARFAVDCGAFSEIEARQFKESAYKALWCLLEDQADHQACQDEISRFLGLLASALSSGRCHAYDLAGEGENGGTGAPCGPRKDKARAFGWIQDGRGELHPQGPCVGWIEGETLYLDGDAAYAIVTRYIHEQGGNIETTQRTLFQRVYERGLLTKVEKDGRKTRLQVQKWIHGAKKRAYALRLSALFEEWVEGA